MVKPEWGTKRTCQKCKAPFYDLKRDPITCPKCNTEFQPDVLKKRRRTRLSGDDEPVKGGAPKNAFALDKELTLRESAEDLEDIGFDQDADLLEDEEDLGDEEEDMQDVIERPADKELE